MRFGRIYIHAAVVCALTFTQAQADAMAPPALSQLDNAKVSAAETVRWLGFRVFDITVYTGNGARYDPSKQAALELRYGRKFTKTSLMAATMEELARLEGPQSDHPTIKRKLASCFADVGPNDRFLAVGPSKNSVTLYRNDKQTCRMSHPNIRARFLDIWLSLDSRFPAVSRRLRGL